MKKAEFLSVRITQETKESLERIAIEKEWTISKTASKAIEEYIERHEKSRG